MGMNYPTTISWRSGEGVLLSTIRTDILPYNVSMPLVSDAASGFPPVSSKRPSGPHDALMPSMTDTPSGFPPVSSKLPSIPYGASVPSMMDAPSGFQPVSSKPPSIPYDINTQNQVEYVTAKNRDEDLSTTKTVTAGIWSRFKRFLHRQTPTTVVLASIPASLVTAILAWRMDHNVASGFTAWSASFTLANLVATHVVAHQKREQDGCHNQQQDGPNNV